MKVHEKYKSKIILQTNKEMCREIAMNLEKFNGLYYSKTQLCAVLLESLDGCFSFQLKLKRVIELSEKKMFNF